jgi:hypothetical protein
MDITKYEQSEFRGKIEEAVRFGLNIRSDANHPKDISLPEIIKEKFNLGLSDFLFELGINPSEDTLHNIYTAVDNDIRWLVPEFFREALLLGYRAAPIWPSIIASEENTTGLSQIMPWYNMSDVAPRKVGEGETIPVGTVSYGSKKFSIYKIGRGIKITDEVSQYSSLKLVSIFLRDFGVKFGHAADTLAIDTLINGEQTDGSESAPVIGVTDTVAGKQYKDLLRLWIRLARIGRTPTTIIGGEAAALSTLDMDEFKKRESGTTEKTLVLKTPVPSSTNYFIHGNVPPNQEIMVDPMSALIKFNAQPLKVESERIVSNQTEAFYATLTTGFAKLFRDAAIIMDSSVLFSSYGFPSYLDVDPYQNVTIE